MTDPAGGLQVSVHQRLSEAEPAWQQLLDAGYGNPYQSPTWLSAWHQTLGKARGTEAAIAVFRLGEKPVAVLPMGIDRAAGIGTLSFLGHRNGNQNTGIWDPEFYAGVNGEQIRMLLEVTCGQTGADLLALHNVPETWHGRQHPLILQTATQSPSPIFVRPLPADFDSLFRETHSKSSRKNLLRKQRHLQEAGGYRVFRATTGADAARVLTVFLDQRARRAEEAGIPNVFSDRTAKYFLEAVLDGDRQKAGAARAVLEAWALEVNGAIRATCLCSEWDGTVHTYSNSVAHDEFLPYSPGLVLMMEIIRHACANPDINTLDLGLGEERYKTDWAEPVVLKDSLQAITLKGVLKARLNRSATRAKTAIRSSGTLWPLVRRFRKWKAGLGTGSMAGK